MSAGSGTRGTSLLTCSAEPPEAAPTVIAASAEENWSISKLRVGRRPVIPFWYEPLKKTVMELDLINSSEQI